MHKMYIKLIFLKYNACSVTPSTAHYSFNFETVPDINPRKKSLIGSLYYYYTLGPNLGTYFKIAIYIPYTTS